MSLSLRFIFYGTLILLCWEMAGCALARKKESAVEKEKTPPPTQTHRAEIESNSYEDEHWVQTLPDSTLLLISSKRNTWFGKNTVGLTKFNRQLAQVWKKEHEVKPGNQLYTVTADQEKTYLLYETRNTKEMLLLTINNRTGVVSESEHVMPSGYLSIMEMKALEGNIFIYALEYSKLNMLLLDPSKEEIRLLPAVFGMEDDLGEFRVDTLSKAAEFVVAESNGWRSRLQTKRLNADGDVIGTYFLQPNMQQYRDDNTLQSARLTPGDTLSKLMIGTYGYRNSLFARGLFTSDLSGNIKYYDFSQLKYFFEYMSPRAERRQKARFEELEAKGKPLVLRYRMLLHSVMPHPQGYAIIGEVYYPQYRSTNYNNNMSATTGVDTRRLFDGYRFTHAIAAVFDHQGNLLWDNSFKLSNETYRDLAPTVEAGVTPEGHIAMVYPKDELLKFKVLKPGLSISNEEEVTVKTMELTEKMVTAEREGLTHWYGNNFLAFGFQRIRPVQGTARTVFYLQKFTFE